MIFSVFSNKFTDCRHKLQQRTLTYSQQVLTSAVCSLAILLWPLLLNNYVGRSTDFTRRVMAIFMAKPNPIISVQQCLCYVGDTREVWSCLDPNTDWQWGTKSDATKLDASRFPKIILSFTMHYAAFTMHFGYFWCETKVLYKYPSILNLDGCFMKT